MTSTVSSARLSPSAFWGVLSVSTLVFLLVDNPLFADPFAIDGSILWSYAIIPALVFALLLTARKLSFRAFLLESGTLALSKFAVTMILACALWAFAEPRPIFSVAKASAPGRGSELVSVAPGRAGAALSSGGRMRLAVGAPLLVRSPDRRLHTVLARRGSKQLFNRPLLPDKPLQVRFHRAFSEVELVCTVHDQRLQIVEVQALEGAQLRSVTRR